MTQVAWSGAVSGDWSVAADWSPQGVPNGSSFDVTIAQTGVYTVSIASAES